MFVCVCVSVCRCTYVFVCRVLPSQAVCMGGFQPVQPVVGGFQPKLALRPLHDGDQLRPIPSLPAKHYSLSQGFQPNIVGFPQRCEYFSNYSSLCRASSLLLMAFQWQIDIRFLGQECASYRAEESVVLTYVRTYVYLGEGTTCSATTSIAETGGRTGCQPSTGKPQ